MRIRTYHELVSLHTFEERFEYLKLSAPVGIATFGGNRYLNQAFYKSKEWKEVRDFVIVRDNACDLAHPDRQLFDRILVHHLNPVTVEDVVDSTEFLLNPEYLVSTCVATHNAIHYGDASLLVSAPIERTPWDTAPWRLPKEGGLNNGSIP